MQPLLAVWKEIEKYIADGISIIPVRDKPQIYKGREYTAKSAYPWEKYKSSIITAPELWHLMNDVYDTTAVAMVMGKVSGNMEAIDVDCKNWPGIEVKLFQDIKSLLPDLFPRLRIIQTPSKGYHIPYRISDHEPGPSKKLAYQKDASEAAIETRGEAAYIVAPPSLNYKVVQSNPIPIITWTERCSLFAICEGYNEKIKVAPFVASKSQNDYYDENPFDHFNGSSEAENVLTQHEWKICGNNNNFIWYTRPGKDSGVSASFNRSKRVFYIFTSSTQFEPSRGYNPASVLALLQFGGDKKKTFLHLTQSGYGKVKPYKEQQKAKTLARKNKPLPANFSPEAKATHAATLTAQTEAHPYGIFWKFNDENNPVISRDLIYKVASCLGYRYHKGDVIRINEWRISKVDEREFQDVLMEYINEPDEDVKQSIVDCYEAFMQRSGDFTMKRLEKLDASLLVSDTKDICHKFYNNGFLIITSTAITFNTYDGFEMLVWSDKVQNRDYLEKPGGKYLDYLQKATDFDKHQQHIMSVIGFLSHEYKDETTAYIIVLTEQCADPKMGGGSGKNVFCNLLSHTTTYTSKPGVQAKYDEKFFQSWNGQKIFCISDVPKNFDFAFLKEPASGNFIWKKLFKDELTVENDDAPKFIIQTNFSYEVTDGGLKRRIIPIEFTDFFTACGGLDVHYGIHFPKGWSNEDWAGYDTFIAECVQSWLKGGRKLHATPLTASGWQKQFKHTYGPTITEFIEQNFEIWKNDAFITNEKFKTDLERFYVENAIQKNYQPSSSRIYDAITAYCAKNELIFENNVPRRIDPLTVVKGKLFTPKDLKF